MIISLSVGINTTTAINFFKKQMLAILLTTKDICICFEGQLIELLLGLAFTIQNIPFSYLYVSIHREYVIRRGLFDDYYSDWFLFFSLFCISTGISIGAFCFASSLLCLLRIYPSSKSFLIN